MDILLVDDNPEYLLLTRDILHAAGYTVHTAQNGAEACDILAGSEIDLIITDIRMPRFDGFKLHAFARATDRYRSTKFIFVSGVKDAIREAVEFDPKVDFFVEKTTPLKDFLHFIDTLVFGNHGLSMA